MAGSCCDEEVSADKTGSLGRVRMVDVWCSDRRSAALNPCSSAHSRKAEAGGREVGGESPGPPSHWAESMILEAAGGVTDGVVGGTGSEVWGVPGWNAEGGAGSGTPAGHQSHALPQRRNETQHTVFQTHLNTGQFNAKTNRLPVGYFTTALQFKSNA